MSQSAFQGGGSLSLVVIRTGLRIRLRPRPLSSAVETVTMRQLMLIADELLLPDLKKASSPFDAEL